MLDIFVIFSKGGIVLWCYQSSKDILLTSVNALIRTVILQERTGNDCFEHESLMMQYRLDNEFELVFVAGYQKILQLTYMDKFLSDIHREIRDRYKTQLLDKMSYFRGIDFAHVYTEILREAEVWSRDIAAKPKVMRSFDQSKKSQKTVASMIDRPSDNSKGKKPTKKANNSNGKGNGVGGSGVQERKDFNENDDDDEDIDDGEELDENSQMCDSPTIGGHRPMMTMGKGKSSKLSRSPKSPKPNGSGDKEKDAKKKAMRKWDLGGTKDDVASLERTKPGEGERDIVYDRSMVGKMSGKIRSLEVPEEDKKKDAASGGVFNIFKGLVGGKTVTNDSIQPVLEKLKDHLIGKNVASDVAFKLCDSVAAKIEGKALGTFQTISSTVKVAMEESLLALLQPKKQVDVLRDALEAKRQKRPFVITFCGVNGVGKSTNLAKICFWLIENDLRVLVAACDTFRAGAVEQLRTHAKHLNALHPPKNGFASVQLYEKGYGKDAAGVAAEAISHARDANIDVVLVDTAGRMQDNEPLMRALSKLIRVNNPDLVLFVGEALVGNEAVDQLVKFNRAMADFSEQANPRLIDGIVLTKFDTIDDKVGAAVSMAYITGQPIVFVGTGQTYTDLRSLDSRAVVAALMK